VPFRDRRSPLARAVLGLNGGPTDELVVQLGIEFARQYGTELVAVHVVEVDWRHSLDDDIAASQEHSVSILDIAEGMAEAARVKLRAQLLQARDVGAALVDEAVALEGEAIVVGLPYRRRFGGDFAMGRTIPYVLENAPSRVYLVRETMAAAAARETVMRRD
jgi:nucleotide-binding universal stress UspA family protein